MKELDEEYERIKRDIALADALNRNLEAKLKFEALTQRNHELQQRISPTFNPDVTFRTLLMRAIGGGQSTVTELLCRMGMKCTAHSKGLVNDFLLELFEQDLVIATKGQCETLFSVKKW